MDDQNLYNTCGTVQWQCAGQSITVPSSRVTRECRSPRLRSPPHFRRPHSSYQRVVQGKCPLHFLNLNGVVCSNTLFSNTSALTSSTGFQFWGPLARTNFLSALCGLPTIKKCLIIFVSALGKAFPDGRQRLVFQQIKDHPHPQ